MSDSDHNHSDLISFPSDFPIKIIGDSTEQFETAILDIARQHHPELADDAIQRKTSAEGNYLAITITVRAVSQEGLDALYTALSKHPETKMVL
jgi:putative lipoic acid-binding regulatory protein